MKQYFLNLPRIFFSLYYRVYLSKRKSFFLKRVLLGLQAHNAANYYKFLAAVYFLVYKGKMVLSKTEILTRQKRLHYLLKKITKRAFFCANTENLIQGVASKVFRRCGKEGCKCKNDNERHGPYFIVQLYENKRQRQVALRKEEQDLWQMVRNYQLQVDSLLQLKKTCAALCNEVNTIIKLRLKKMENLRCKKQVLS